MRRSTSRWGITEALESADIVAETREATCSDVATAVRRFTGWFPSTVYDYLVLHAGSRYIAMDPAGVSPLVFSMSAQFDDVRLSLVK